MMPGNPYSLPEGNPIYEEEVSRLALDKNIIIQFFYFLVNLMLGYWGRVYHYNSGSTDSLYINQALLSEWRMLDYYRFLELIFSSIVTSLIIGVFFGILISKYKNRKKGKILRVLNILLWAIPIVLFGYLFQYIFRYSLHWIPGCSGATYSAYLEKSDFITNFPLIDCLLSGKGFWDRLLYLITPVSTLNLIMIPTITYFTYKLIEHFKSSRNIPNFTKNLGFFYSIIVTSTLLIYPIVCTHDLTANLISYIDNECFNPFILSMYLVFITFFILNLLFNLIICAITLYHEQRDMKVEKKSLIEEKSGHKKSNSVINEEKDKKTPPKKKIIHRKHDPRIFIATVMISLGFFIIFLLLRKKFLIYLGILGIIICIPLIPKKWRLKLTSKTEIESTVSKIDLKSSNEEKSTIINNRYSKSVILTGSILIIISIIGIAIYGWDDSGKNIFKTQTTLIIGIFASLVSIIGVIFGFLSAYFGKWVKKIIDSFVLIFISIPCIMILSIIVQTIGTADFNIIWIIGLIGIPIITQISAEIILNEMKKNKFNPVLVNGKNPSNSFRNIIRDLIFPIIGVFSLNIGMSIILFEGYNVSSFLDFLDPSFFQLGSILRTMRTGFDDPTQFLLAFTSGFLLFLIVSGFLLLGLGLYDYKLKKKSIPKEN
jgi:ABC-type dipeptide/oligopeptide/nickel transport system permease component